MKTLFTVLLSVAGGAVGACILMRVCKKKKLPCGCHDKETETGTTPVTAETAKPVAAATVWAGTPQLATDGIGSVSILKRYNRQGW